MRSGAPSVSLNDMIPPPLPSNNIYTSCWCEENIYLLCQNFVQNRSVRDLWEIFTIFISNSDKTVSGHNFFEVLEPVTPNNILFPFSWGCFLKVALWYQKAAQCEEVPVVWDYHVVLLLRPRQGVEESTGFNENDMSWVYDFDTTLPVPCPGQGKSSFDRFSG